MDDTRAVQVMHALREIAPHVTLWNTPPRFPEYLLSPCGLLVSLVNRRPRLLAPGMKGKYVGFALRNEAGEIESVYLHRLMLETFEGPAGDGLQGAHLDGNRKNNTVGNLRWVTAYENAQHKKLHGTSGKGSKSSQAKLTEQLVNQMRAVRATTQMTYKQIAQQSGVSTMTAFRAITGRLWSHVEESNV